MLRPFYPWMKSHRNSLNRSLGESQSRSGCFYIRKNLLSLPRTQQWVLWILHNSLVTADWTIRNNCNVHLHIVCPLCTEQVLKHHKTTEFLTVNLFIYLKWLFNCANRIVSGLLTSYKIRSHYIKFNRTHFLVYAPYIMYIHSLTLVNFTVTVVTTHSSNYVPPTHVLWYV
jgi:hypothetical protein